MREKAKLEGAGEEDCTELADMDLFSASKVNTNGLVCCRVLGGPALFGLIDFSPRT